jgi:hypothetical protein
VSPPSYEYTVFEDVVSQGRTKGGLVRLRIVRLGASVAVPSVRLGRLAHARCNVAAPDQATPGCLHHLRIGKAHRLYEILERLVIEPELALEHAIRHPAPVLEHCYGLVEEVLEGHHLSSAQRVATEVFAVSAYRIRT